MAWFLRWLLSFAYCQDIFRSWTDKISTLPTKKGNQLTSVITPLRTNDQPFHLPLTWKRKINWMISFQSFTDTHVHAFSCNYRIKNKIRPVLVSAQTTWVVFVLLADVVFQQLFYCVRRLLYHHLGFGYKDFFDHLSVSFERKTWNSKWKKRLVSSAEAATNLKVFATKKFTRNFNK